MTLRELLQAAGVPAPEGGGDPDITGLAYRSESATPGALFFCVPGFVVDGHDFAPDAVERGAAAVVCERPLGLDVPEVVVPGVRAAMGPLAAAFHGHPTAQLRVVGVTGTNGKTTTAFLVRHILEAQGIRDRAARHRPLGRRRQRRGGRAHDPGGRRPAGDVPPDARRGRRRVRDGGLLARARAVPGGGHPLRRAPCSRTSPRTTSTSTGRSTTTSRRSDGCSCPSRACRPAVAVVNVDDDWGEQLASEITAAGHTPVATFAIERRRRLPRDGRRLRRVGRDLHVLTHAVPPWTCALPLPGLFNVYNALARDRVRARARRGAARRGAGAASPRSACRGGSSPWTRDRPSPCSWTTRTPPTRSRTCWRRRADCWTRRRPRAG